MINISKGQAISITILFAVILIPTFFIYNSMAAGEEFSEEVSLSTGDVEKLAETKVKEEMYRYNIRKELNYSLDIVALNNQRRDLGRISLTSYNDLKNEYHGEVQNHLENQNRVLGCISPTIESINRDSENRSIVEFSNSWIECEGQYSTASVKVEDSYRVINDKNRYTDLLNHSYLIADKVGERWDEDTKDEYEGEVEGECDRPPVGFNPNHQYPYEEAQESAIRSAESDLEQLMEEELDGHQSEFPEGIGTSNETETNYIDFGDFGRIPISTEDVPKYDVMLDRSDGDLDEEKNEEVGSCSCGPYDDSEDGNCDKVDVTYEFEVQEPDAWFELLQTENQVLNEQGQRQSLSMNSTFSSLVG